MAVIGVLVLVLIVTAYASHSHDSGSPGVQVRTNDRYQAGSCVAVTSGPTAVIVPCDQPHTGQIASTTDYPRPCPEDTYAVPLVAEQETLCLTE